VDDLSGPGGSVTVMLDATLLMANGWRYEMMPAITAVIAAGVNTILQVSNIGIGISDWERPEDLLLTLKLHITHTWFILHRPPYMAESLRNPSGLF